jgi:hypothetical protein
LDASKILKVNKKELANVKKVHLSTLVNGPYFEIHYAIMLPKESKIESQLMIPQAVIKN